VRVEVKVREEKKEKKVEDGTIQAGLYMWAKTRRHPPWDGKGRKKVETNKVNRTELRRRGSVPVLS